MGLHAQSITGTGLCLCRGHINDTLYEDILSRVHLKFNYKTGLTRVRIVGIPVSAVIWFHGCTLYTTEGQSATKPKSHVLMQDGFMSFKIVLQNANILFFIFWSLE